LAERRPRSLLWGGAIIGAVLLAALSAQLVAPYPFDQFHIRDRLQPPSLQFLAGTDEFGRDVFSRVLIGSQLSLALGAAATVISLSIGVPLGLLCGYRRGLLDEAVMRVLDLLMAFPPVLLVLLLLVVTPPSLLKTAIAVGVLFVPSTTRVARSVALDLAGADFIEAARARGEHSWYILLRELLPNMWPVLIVEGSLRLVFAILLGATLSFLGFGVQPPDADWGLMISSGREFGDVAPWISLAPGLAIALTVVGVSLLGDGLREVLDSRGRR
jgi:peptide/nickel transport system permease protein